LGGQMRDQKIAGAIVVAQLNGVGKRIASSAQ
jgi:hypothetical protein